MKKTKEERFWSNVRKSENCWEWTRGLTHNGYGVFYTSSFGKKQFRAHRFCWEISFGKIPQGLLVCHTCDNPKCVRPSHLFLGTHSDNSKDMMRKGRSRSAGLKGEKSPYHKLNDEKVRKIREMHKNGVSQADIARIFCVNKTAVNKVILRQNWSHVV